MKLNNTIALVHSNKAKKKEKEITHDSLYWCMVKSHHLAADSSAIGRHCGWGHLHFSPRGPVKLETMPIVPAFAGTGIIFRHPHWIGDLGNRQLYSQVFNRFGKSHGLPAIVGGDVLRVNGRKSETLRWIATSVTVKSAQMRKLSTWYLLIHCREGELAIGIPKGNPLETWREKLSKGFRLFPVSVQRVHINCEVFYDREVAEVYNPIPYEAMIKIEAFKGGWMRPQGIHICVPIIGALSPSSQSAIWPLKVKLFRARG